MYSDTIADMLTRIRNGCRARLERVEIPNSKLKVRMAEILKQEGYIQDFRVIKDLHQGLLEVKLKYGDDHQPVIAGIRKVSKPGNRAYLRCTDIPKVRNGLGTLILTTSRGLMTDRDARAAKVGGEALCAVW
jgi:small subunit ribosomal protein S8